jgi:receptor protein-tyrosine kinase
MTKPPSDTPPPPASRADGLASRAGERLRAAEGGSMIERAAERLRRAADTGLSAATPSPGAIAGEPPMPRPRFPPGRSARQPIDFARLDRDGMITPESGYSALAEQFRILKRPLLLDAFRRAPARPGNANVLMVTSARPGEGKTFVACNLALSIAQEHDFSVLLVDADVRHPSVANVLGIVAGRGLTDILADPAADPGDAMIRAANLPNLAIVPAGRIGTGAPELFASQRMARLLDEFAGRYPDRITIIDTPPVLASSEPSVISLHAGQALMVVEADRTSARAVQSALALLRQCPSISLVLNKARGSLGAEEFGQYGYAYADRRDAAATTGAE